MFPVSIPFIAGQWSLPYGHRPMWAERPTGFNPLHCGAVVASSVRTLCVATQGGRVSIPFIAGQWSLLGVGGLERRRRPHVSIPFIAGQWSLRAGRM